MAGVLRPRAGPQGRAMLAPVQGRIYLTQDVSLAQIHAMGGAYAGHELPESLKKGGTAGHVFAVRIDDSMDVVPDEDNVGSLVTAAENIDRPVSPYSDQPRLDHNMRGDSVFSERMTGFLRECATEIQWRRARDGEMAYQAAIGKKAIKLMPTWMKQKLLDYGANAAVRAESLPIESAWRLEHSQTIDLVRDGSNFFQVARPVVPDFSDAKQSESLVEALRESVALQGRGWSKKDFAGALSANLDGR